MARTSTVPANETKEQKSVRLARARMGTTLNKLKNIANLGGSGYALTDAQKNKMLADLQAAVDRIEESFSRKRGEQAGAGGYEL